MPLPGTVTILFPIRQWGLALGNFKIPYVSPEPVGPWKRLKQEEVPQEARQWGWAQTLESSAQQVLSMWPSVYSLCIFFKANHGAIYRMKRIDISIIDLCMN